VINRARCLAVFHRRNTGMLAIPCICVLVLAATRCTRALTRKTPCWVQKEIVTPPFDSGSRHFRQNTSLTLQKLLWTCEGLALHISVAACSISLVERQSRVNTDKQYLFFSNLGSAGFAHCPNNLIPFLNFLLPLCFLPSACLRIISTLA